MGQAYTPGLLVTSAVRHRARRVLPISGEVLVNEGDVVEAEQTVARSFIPGDITPINLANKLAVPAGEVPGLMLKKEGDVLERGELLARTNGIFGFFKAEYRSDAEGVIETISPITGQVIVRGEPIPVDVRAYLPGQVIERLGDEGVVIEADVALIQGIFGIGGEAFGTIRNICSTASDELSDSLIDESMQGQIVIGGGRMTGAAVRKAIEVGVAAVVSGGMDDQDLFEILGYDLGVAITGSESIGTTLVVTEGFGEIAMAERTFELLKAHEGQRASVNGATQIRAGVMRPEIVIAHTEDTAAPDEDQLAEAGLETGRAVRMIRDPYFGLLGTVTELPAEPCVLGSESRARVLEVELRDGQRVIVPRANVELMEG